MGEIRLMDTWGELYNHFEKKLKIFILKMIISIVWKMNHPVYMYTSVSCV